MLAFRFRFLRFPVLSCLVSLAFFPGSGTQLSVCFLSPFPDSLPTAACQVLTFFPVPCVPFLFGIFRFPSASFRPLLFRFRLLSLCFFRSVLPVSASQWLIRCAVSALASSVSPVLPSLVSHAFLPGSGTQLSVRFLSSLPVSLPQLFHRCFPSFPLSLLLWAFSFRLAFFRPLIFRSDYSAFRSFFSPLPDLP